MDDGSWGYAYQRSRKRTPLIRSFFHGKGFPGGLDGKASARNAEDLGSIPGLERSLEKEMTTHSSTLAWKIPWM